MKAIILTPLFLSLVFLGGCGSDSNDFPSWGSQLSPVAVDGVLAILDREDDSVLLISPDKKAGPGGNQFISRVQVGEQPTRSMSAPVPEDPAQTRVLFMDPSANQLVILHDRLGTTTNIDLGAPLDYLNISHDGRYAIAFSPAGSAPTDSLFSFPNTIAVVDLQEDALSATTILLGSFGLRTTGAVFSRPMQLEVTSMESGSPVTEIHDYSLAFIFVTGGLVPVNLQTGVVGELVPLSPDLDRDIIPSEVLFTHNEGDTIRGRVDSIERAFVRSADGELYVLVIAANPAAPEEILVSVENIVTPRDGVSDVELFHDEVGTEVLLAAAGRDLILVNGYTGVAEYFEEPVQIDSLRRYEDSVTGEAKALAFSHSSSVQKLLLLDPLMLQRRRASGLETIEMGRALLDVEVKEGGEFAVLVYQQEEEFGILQLRSEGDLLDLRFASSVDSRFLDDSGNELWVSAMHPSSGAPSLAAIRLDDNLGVREVELDDMVQEIGFLGDWVWTSHYENGESVTLFPRADLNRSSAISFRDIFLTDLIDLESNK